MALRDRRVDHYREPSPVDAAHEQCEPFTKLNYHAL